MVSERLTLEQVDQQVENWRATFNWPSGEPPESDEDYARTVEFGGWDRLFLMADDRDRLQREVNHLVAMLKDAVGYTREMAKEAVEHGSVSPMAEWILRTTGEWEGWEPGGGGTGVAASASKLREVEDV